MTRKDGRQGSRLDDDNPEWLPEEIRAAQPALTVIAEVFGPRAAAAIGRDRPGNAGEEVDPAFQTRISPQAAT